jgi:hypothetical protein
MNRVAVEEIGVGTLTVHSLDPAGAVVPAGQAVQAMDSKFALNVSTGQSRHASRPVWSAKVPGEQASQVPPGTGFAVPSRQSSQNAAPTWLEVPGTQAKH